MKYAEELAKNVCIDGAEPRKAILAALIEYGLEVRRKAAQECDEGRVSEESARRNDSDYAYNQACGHCAESIEKMELP